MEQLVDRVTRAVQERLLAQGLRPESLRTSLSQPLKTDVKKAPQKKNFAFYFNKNHFKTFCN